MAQHDYNIANQSGADFRADLNNALSAIATVNSGASEPSTTFAHQLWVDTSNNVLKIRNAANSAFITTGVSITASNTFTGNLTGNVTGDLTGNADTATTLATARTINGVSFNGSANISFNTDSVAEGSSNLYFTNERVDDQVNALLQAGTGIQLTYDDTAGTLTIANTNDADITGVVAGNGLTGGGTAGSVTLNVAVDDSSIEIDSDALRVKASGITNTMLAGSIANSKLANSSVTINSQSLALGGTLVLDTDNIGEGSSNLYYTTARVNSAFDTRLATKDTGDLSEGSNLYFTNERVDDRVSTLIQNGTGISWSYDDTAGTFTPTISLSPFNTSQLSESGNLYYTDARARAAISENSTQLSYNSTTGVLTYTQGDTDTVSEGSNNLYYTSARANTDFDTRLATKSTSNLAEGTNLYYTTARFDSAFTSKDTDDLSEGTTNLYYTQSRFDSAFGNKTTANLTENTNLYYTDTRANSAIDARVVKSFVDALGIQATSVADNSVVLGNDTTGNYIQTVTGTANKITVSGSGSESADITLSLPDDVQIASDLTVAGNLTVNGTLTSLDTTNLDIEDNLFQLNAGLTGSPVNDSGMLINRGSSDNGIFMWDESVDKFTLGLTTADGSATGNITLSSLGTLVANLEGSVTGNITGQVSDISNFTTANLTENTNLYYTQARFDSALAAKSTTNLSEGSNLYYTDARFDTRLASKDTDDVSEGTNNLYYTSTRFNSAFSGKSTSDLSEGTNLYYTDARVQAVSINNVVEDTTPQLGGNLDLNSSDITGTGDINITGTIQSSGNITGTLATAAQPNITSVGTLTGLDVSGTPTFDGLTVDGTAQATRLGLGAAPHATAGLNITTTNQHIRLNNGSELGIISLLSGGELDIWGHGDSESINFRTGSGVGTVVMNVVGSNVGIGQDTPVRPLHLSTSSGGSIIHLTDDSTGHTATDGVDIQQEGTLLYILNREAGDIRFGTSATERMRIDSSGSLLVNTTSAGSNRLKIVGDASRYGILSENLSGYGSFNLKSTTVAQTWSIGAVDNSSNSDLFIYGGSSAGTKVTLASSGSVGIGCSPSGKLHVEGATSGANLLIDDGTGFGVYVASQNAFNFNYGNNATSTGYINFRGYQDGATQFRNLNIGNGKQGTVAFFDGVNSRFGIGTDSPTSQLDVRGVFHVGASASTTPVIGRSLAPAGSQGLFLTAGLVSGESTTTPTFADNSSSGASIYLGGNAADQYGGSVILKAYGAGADGNLIVFENRSGANTFKEAMRITSAGLVAINTTTVASESALNIGAVAGAGTQEGGQLVLQKGSGGTKAIHIDNYNNAGVDYCRFMRGSDTGSEAVLGVWDITNTRFGIGTATPAQTLTVAGSAWATGYYITALQGNSQLTNASTSSGSNPSYIGQGLISVTVSDAKAKENFGSVETNECLNKIVSLSEHVKKFDWIDEDWKKEKGRTVGMVAQEIYEDHSEFVHKPENYDDDGWAIRYQEIVPTLVKAIQEQQELINNLTARIEQLEI